jgi:hypothetical protein
VPPGEQGGEIPRAFRQQEFGVGDRKSGLARR